MEAKKKFFLWGAFFALILVVSFFFSLPDGKLHVVFCDVGQGDGIYLRFPNGTDILVDGGPNNKVLQCLGKYMAFWDRKIEIVILTHPQADHLSGLLEVLKRFEVETVLLPPVGNKTKSFSELKKLVEDKKISFHNLYKNHVVQFQTQKGKSLNIKILWPEEQWVRERLNLADAGGSWNNNILGASTSQNLNAFSIAALVSYSEFDVLLTGDLEADLLAEALKESKQKIEVLKVPHHGGKNGLSKNIIDNLKPKLAVISVGKNAYGHPNEITLDLLRENKIQILRTDQEGDIEIVSDGEKWEVLLKNPSLQMKKKDL